MLWHVCVCACNMGMSMLWDTRVHAHTGISMLWDTCVLVHVDIACCGTHVTVSAQLLELILSSLVCPEDRPKSSASHVGPRVKSHAVIYLCLFILCVGGMCRGCLCREKEPVLLPPMSWRCNSRHLAWLRQLFPSTPSWLPCHFWSVRLNKHSHLLF